MAIQLGTGGKVSPVINVTPLVDVVLVLLIIFMVVVPLLEKEMTVNLPADVRTEPVQPVADQIIVDLAKDGKVTVAGVQVARSQLQATIAHALAGRQRRVVFFSADDEALYGDAVAVLDAARGAGAETIGTVLSSSAEGR